MSGATADAEAGGDPAREERLLAAASTGDADAFTHLYHRYATTVRGTLLAHMPRQEVPDALQEVFLTAWQKLSSLRNSEAFGGWLAAIARNVARQYFRRRAPSADAGDEQAAPSTAALEVLSALQTLPASYRETMMLRFVEGMTGPEIATRTGLTPGSVRVNLHRGVRLLREQLGAGRNRHE